MAASTVAVYGPVPFWMKSVSDCDGCRFATGAGSMDNAGGEAEGEADGDGCGVVSDGGGGGGVACIPAASSIEKNKPTPCCTRVNGCEPARRQLHYGHEFLRTDIPEGGGCLILRPQSGRIASLTVALG